LKVLSVRRPDGKYLICRDTSRTDKLHVVVTDADTGKPTCSLELAAPEFPLESAVFVWLGQREAAAWVGKKITRFDYHTGKVLSTKAVAGSLYPRDVAVDAGTISWVEGNARFGEVELFRLDLDTAKVKKLGATRMKRFTGNKIGFVPGGRFLHVADPDFYLLDRQTLKVVSRREFRGVDLLGLAFTADGKRFAVAAGSSIYIDRQLRTHDANLPTLIRVHDTRTGKTRAAFAPRSRWVFMRFSPGGRRLAVVNDDRTIELWQLPEVDR
jgi:hypothetical protein